MAYSQTKYHLVVIRFAIVCLAIGMICFLTGVSLRSLDVLRKPSMCFGGNNYEFLFLLGFAVVLCVDLFRFGLLCFF